MSSIDRQRSDWIRPHQDYKSQPQIGPRKSAFDVVCARQRWRLDASKHQRAKRLTRRGPPPWLPARGAAQAQRRQIVMDGSGGHVSGLTYLDALTSDVRVSENDMGTEVWHAKVAIFASFHSMTARHLRATTVSLSTSPRMAYYPRHSSYISKKLACAPVIVTWL